jgi:hypothetical protein
LLVAAPSWERPSLFKLQSLAEWVLVALLLLVLFGLSLVKPERLGSTPASTAMLELSRIPSLAVRI